MRLAYNVLNELQSLEPLGAAAERAGYEVEYANTPPEDGEAVEITIYSGHARYPDMPKVNPTNAAFSVVMVHDLGQNTWPADASAEDNLWQHEPWDIFDVGILPGRTWSEAWRRASAEPGAYPRLGVYELGYTKADPAFNGDPVFKEEVRKLREELGLKDRPTILLAPSWLPESNDRFWDFARSLEDLDLNLVVKYTPGDQRFLARMRAEYSNPYGNVSIADLKANIMHCLAVSDVIISDESSCVAEATLFDVPGICISDWNSPPVPDPWNVPERPPRPIDFTQQVSASQMRETVQKTLAEMPRHKEEIRRVRDEYFTNLGTSSEKIVELVDYLANVPYAPLGHDGA